MLLILFLLIGMRWIRSGFPPFLAFLMGGVLGLAMLIRTQVVVAVPILLFFSLREEKPKDPLQEHSLDAVGAYVGCRPLALA